MIILIMKNENVEKWNEVVTILLFYILGSETFGSYYIRKGVR